MPVLEIVLLIQPIVPAKWTHCKLNDVLDTCFVHCSPPFVVCKITPFSPTAHPVESLIKYKLYNAVLTVECCVTQSAPPFVVCKMRPPAPTVHPVASLAKNMSVSCKLSGS